MTSVYFMFALEPIWIASFSLSLLNGRSILLRFTAWCSLFDDQGSMVSRTSCTVHAVFYCVACTAGPRYKSGMTGLAAEFSAGVRVVCYNYCIFCFAKPEFHFESVVIGGRCYRWTHICQATKPCEDDGRICESCVTQYHEICCRNIHRRKSR
jgi:hypothetical protein